MSGRCAEAAFRSAVRPTASRANVGEVGGVDA